MSIVLGTSKLPEGWQILQLGKITSKMRNGFVGKATNHYAEDSDSIAYVQGYNVKPNKIIYQGMKRVSASFNAANPNSQLKANDVLTTQTGEVGTSALVPKELEGANCHALIISRFKEDLASHRFYTQFFNSPMGMRALQEISSGAILKHINVGEMVKLKVPVPPVAVQEVIADCLGVWDYAIDLTERSIVAKQERLAWLLQQLLTGKRRLPGFRSEWRKTTVGEIAEEVSIRNKGKLGIDEVRAVNKSEGMIPMKSHVMADDLSRYKMVERTWFAYNPMRINIGSICQLMGEEKALVSPDYVVFRCKEQRIDHRFFNAFRRSHRWQSFMDASGNGSVRVRIYFEDLARLTVLLPSLDEQRSIADVIDIADRELDLLLAQLDALREQKKGLMQQLLTGKVRVKV